jgi:hypothetical protein
MGQRAYANGIRDEKQNIRFPLKFGVLLMTQFDLIQIHSDFPENLRFFSERNYKFVVNFYKYPA